MTLLQAVFYFFGEAIVSLRRGWRTTLFAVLTIAISLFVGGVFLLVGGNAGRLVAEWRGEARIILYLSDLLSVDDREELRDEMARRPDVESVVLVSGEEAAERFRDYFPRMVDVLDEAAELELPSSLELRLAPGAADDRRAWVEGWSADPRVDSVDDDVEWLGRLDRGLALARLAASALWLVFAAGTMITIASLVRLSAFVYREEIAVMRLVGATEFVIRGPFYLEGLLQGLLGGSLAVTALYGAHGLLGGQMNVALAEALLGEFLAPAVGLALIAAGGFAGLVGALISIPRE